MSPAWLLMAMSKLVQESNPASRIKVNMHPRIINRAISPQVVVESGPPPVGMSWLAAQQDGSSSHYGRGLGIGQRAATPVVQVAKR